MKTSPTQRTLKLLRSDGWGLVQVVEHWNGFARIRQDLFGFIDVLAVSGNYVLGVQTTTASHVWDRVEKIKASTAALCWLASPSRLLRVHGWKKSKSGRWECRIIHLSIAYVGDKVEIVTKEV